MLDWSQCSAVERDPGKVSGAELSLAASTYSNEDSNYH